MIAASLRHTEAHLLRQAQLASVDLDLEALDRVAQSYGARVWVKWLNGYVPWSVEVSGTWPTGHPVAVALQHAQASIETLR